MRRRLFRCYLGLAIASVLLLIWYTHSSLNGTVTCHYDWESQSKVLNMAYRVHHYLVKLKISHCLCYSALWGAIHKGNILPWEGDIEFCVLSSELRRMEDGVLKQHLQDDNLLLNYNSGEGFFSITNMSSSNEMNVKLVIFEAVEENDMMRRIGWKRSLLPANCEVVPSLECFPSRLIMKPLPKLQFGSQSLPVPREGIEMLKYHYPENWWLDITPHNCK